MTARAIALGILREFVFWSLMTGSFLFAYVRYFDAPISTIGAHLVVISTALLGLLGLRFLNWTLVSNERIARQLGACAIALFACTLAGYYILVIGGLGSWGRVASWTLISTYAQQGPQLLQAMNVPPFLALGAAIVVVTAAWGIVDRIVIREDWIQCSKDFPSAVRIVAFSCVVAAGCIQGYGFIAYPRVAQKEPISLTFFPEQTARKVQNNFVYSRTSLDRAELAARTAYIPNATAERKNVFLIVGDALRADHMGLYGYERATTPNLDLLAQGGGLQAVPHVISACAESSCGLLAMSVSRYLHQLPDRPFSLQDVLREHGYSIQMVLGGDHTHFYGLREAYGKVDHYFDGADAKGHYINDDRLVIDHLSALPDWNGRPVMMQIHLMSSHVLAGRHQQWRKFTPEVRYVAHTLLMGAGSDISDDHNGAVNYYDNGVLQFDAFVAQILSVLKSKGYLSNSLVVITGDHGELLGEHGLFGHSKTVFNEVLGIPLLFARFGYESPSRFDDASIASQIDIAPTILRELGIRAPETWRGLPLQEPRSRTVVHFQQQFLSGILEESGDGEQRKYWRDSRDNSEFVFFLSEDRKEQNNMVTTVGSADLNRWRIAVLPTIEAGVVPQP